MGRIPRVYSECGMYFVTARTFQARLLLAPKEGVSETLAGILAKACERTGVKIHAFVAMSNHIHLLVSAHGTSLSTFMQYFLGNAARKVGRLVNWAGSFWQRRFSMEPVLDDDASIRRLRYVLAHGVKEGLVSTPDEWPGLSCLDLLRTEEAITTRFFRWTKRWQAGSSSECDDPWNERWAEPVKLELSPLPCWVALSRAQRRQCVEALVADIVAEGAITHARTAGAQEVVAADPHRTPLRSKKSTRPICHASTSRAFLDFRIMLRDWVAWFAQASAKFRAGDWTVEFPPWAFRPSAPSHARHVN